VELVDGSIIEAGWVTVSAGVFGSPSILMRSGIGPAEDLRSLGIPVLADLPGVGTNLLDHPGFELECSYSGVARAAPILHSIATFHSSTTASHEPPDLMLWVSDPVGAPGEPASFSIEVVLLKPKSTGKVLLRSADPMDQPRVQLPNLGDGNDVDRLVEGFGLALELANRPELRSLCTPPLTPAPTDLRRSIRAEAYPIPHFVGTCSMGQTQDESAVVDHFGQVHGTEGLSVIDASIMPAVPSGFPHISTIMIAERLAEKVAVSL
jgi:choline dehydrogenase